MSWPCYEGHDLQAVDLTQTKLLLTQDAMRTCEALLREAGSHGVERLVLVAGQPNDGNLVLNRVYLPKQRASPISVSLLPDSLIPIHQELATDGYLIALQIHTHPGDAFHTGTDDADTTVTQLGSLSIVVPLYAAHGLAGWPGCIAYLLTHDGWSEPVDPNDLLVLVES